MSPERMRVAALYDIHANAVALRAVLAELEYDIRAAEAELREGGWPGVDDFLRNSLLDRADPLAIADSLERQAQEA